MFRKLCIAAVAAVLSSVSGLECRSNTTAYDYVVVGSGPGGGTLAANLAREGYSVFLIEAGADHGDDLRQVVPAWYGLTTEQPDMSWQFFVNHFADDDQAFRDDKYAYRYENGSYYVGLDPPEGVTPVGIVYPRGMTLGGSAQLNAMNFVIPPDSEWNHFVEVTGDKSWSPEEMRRHFTTLEDTAYIAPGTPGHGFDGYVGTNRNNLSYIIDRPGINDIAREAISLIEGKPPQNDEHLGTLLQRDINSDDSERYDYPYVAQLVTHTDDMRRRSGSRSYIADTMAARGDDGSPAYSLTVSPHSLAVKVLFEESKDGGNPKANGVEYLVGEGLYAADLRYNETDQAEKRTVCASGEVIISGGAFNTPQILKLSGVGPRTELESFGIPVVVDNPAVGEHLQDHYEGAVIVRSSVEWPDDPLGNCTFDPAADPCFDDWENNQAGPYVDAAAALSFTFKSSVAQDNETDIYVFGSPGFEASGFYPGFSQSEASPRSFTWSVVRMQQANDVGTVTLRSSNPRDTPIINFNFFEKQRDMDLQAMAETTDLLIEIMESVGEPYTPMEVVQPALEDMEQSIMDLVFGHHASGSCRMGFKDDPDACVDGSFRVNGADNLRVVDASIFPRPPGGFPVAPTFIISHKAFEAILADAKEE